MSKKIIMQNDTDRENKISYFKNFYISHLTGTQNRASALSDIKLAISIKEKYPGSTTFSRLLSPFVEKEIELQNILKKHFKPSLLELYKKKAEVKPLPYKKFLRSNPDESAISAFFSAVGESMMEEREQNKAQSEYELKILKYTHWCLSLFGLHPNIAQREEKKYKKFNVLIKHKAHSRIVVEDYILEMSPLEFEQKFVQYYKHRKPILIKGKLVPHNKIVEVKITTSFLEGNEVKLFLLSKNHRLVSEEENKKNFLFTCIDETDRYLPHPDEDLVNIPNDGEYRSTKIALINFPNALQLFNSAITKSTDSSLGRNCMDDLRLCLETLLKEKLKNKKSLENQTSPLGIFVKSKGGNNTVAELFHKVIDFYARYQNENVKHNSNVSKGDVKLILNLTSTLIIHLTDL